MREKHQSRTQRENNMKCAFCSKQITHSNVTNEHIFPNVIGGRKVVRNFICRDCNNKTGAHWDNELANQLRPLCTRLGINRHYGRNQSFTVKTVKDRNLIVHPDGSMTIAKPVFDERHLGERTEIKIQARTMKELKKMVSGLQKRHKEIDIDEVVKKAKTAREYAADPYEIPLDFGGHLAGRSVVKSCLALAYDAGLSIDQCEHAKSYLLSDGEACFGYFSERDLVKNRPEGKLFHCIYLCGDPTTGLILAYVEYFGWQRIVACLSSNYVGEAFSHCYTIDPIAGVELDLDVSMEIEPDEIPDIYAYKKIDYGEVRRSLGVLLEACKKQDEERAMSNAVDDALEFACSECGVKPGDVLSKEKSTEITRIIADRLEPFLLHLISGGFSAEDVENIETFVKKSQEALPTASNPGTAAGLPPSLKQ